MIAEQADNRFVAGVPSPVHRWVLLFYVALATIFLWDVLFQDRSLSAFDVAYQDLTWRSEYMVPRVNQLDSQDSPTAHYPQRRFDWSSLRARHDPSVNTYIFSGMPWLSEGIGAFVTSWPQLLFSTANAFDWTAWFRLILAAAFMYWCLLQFGVGVGPAVFGGIVWAYNLHQIVWLEFPQHLGTQLWIPVLFGLNQLILRQGFSRPAVLALVLTNVLFATAGYTQIVLYTFLALGLYNTLYLVIAGSGGVVARLARWCKLHAVYVFAALLYGVYIYIQVDALQQGLRGAQEWRGNFHFAELSLKSLLDFFPSLIPPVQELQRMYSPDYYGGVFSGGFSKRYSNPVEWEAYAGSLTVLFAFYALWSLRRRSGRRQTIVLLLVLGILYSVIYSTALMIWVFQYIPFVGKGNYSRFMTLIVFFLALISAVGLKHFVDAVKDARRGGGSVPWVLLLALAVMFAIPMLVRLSGHDYRLSELQHAAVVCGGFMVLAGLACKWFPRPALIAGLAVAVLAGDLIYSGYRFNSRMDNELIFPTNSTLRYLQQDTDIYRVAVVPSGIGYHPNILSYYQVPEVSGYYTVVPMRYVDFVQGMMRAEVTQNGIMAIKTPNLDILRIMNVKYLISPTTIDDARVEQVFFANNNYLYRIRDWLGRAYCAERVEYAKGRLGTANALRRAAAETSRPATLSGPAQPVVTHTGTCVVDGLQAYTGGFEAEVNSDEPATLVMNYLHQPGWRAYIDGQPAVIQTANSIFMAIEVPAGRHHVRLTHRNDQYLLYAILCLVLGLATIYSATRTHGTVRRAALLALGALIAGKSAVALPGVNNPRVPERSPVSHAEPIRIPGAALSERKLVSARMAPGVAFNWDIPAPTEGLIRLRLAGGTYKHETLDGELLVELFDPDGRLLRRVTVPGRRIYDSRWFAVDFPRIDEVAPGFKVRVTGRYGPDVPFAMWQASATTPNFETFYEYPLR